MNCVKEAIQLPLLSDLRRTDFDWQTVLLLYLIASFLKQWQKRSGNLPPPGIVVYVDGSLRAQSVIGA